MFYFIPISFHFIQLSVVMEETTACQNIGSVMAIPIVKMEQMKQIVSLQFFGDLTLRGDYVLN